MPPPPGFGALRSIAIGAYKRDGGGAKITSPHLARVFLFAAVMYVDDTDLLHWAESPEDKDEELIESVQRDVKAWGEIVQSTGGILKAMKCSLFLLTYKWPNGRARLKTMNDLSPSPYEVVVETPAGEEDKVYPSHVKIPRPIFQSGHMSWKMQLKCLVSTTPLTRRKATMSKK
jgi:hypothetical protein